jgi:hypothetical protein
MYFTGEMTRIEALTTLYTVVEGKSKEEIEQIKEEYKKVIPLITHRELADNDGWLTSYCSK